jgi:HEAT repeat protein
LLDHPDGDVRAGAAYALGTMATAPAALDEDATAVLLAKLRSESPAVRRHVGFVLARVAAENPEALRSQIRPVVGGIADSDPVVRRNLVHTLDDLGSAFPDVTDTVRSEVVEVLAGTDPMAESTDVDAGDLRGVATDEFVPADIRHAAREALATSAAESVAPAEAAASDRQETGASGTGDDTQTCPDCGEQFDADATFCAVCGTPLD